MFKLPTTGSNGLPKAVVVLKVIEAEGLSDTAMWVRTVLVSLVFLTVP